MEATQPSSDRTTAQTELSTDIEPCSPHAYGVRKVILFDRADGCHMLHRRAWCEECARDYELEIIGIHLARGAESAADYPLPLRVAINACTKARAGLMVAELSCLSSNPRTLLYVINKLREPNQWSSAGVPLIVAGYGTLAHGDSDD
jgi:hypothetical protein